MLTNVLTEGLIPRVFHKHIAHMDIIVDDNLV